ncbi:MAG: tol-pal system-associated acyl-CoA thioesterase [Tepidiphilus sp.]|nr:tol-pal system-associated acyl-CoA thioesterase [Tepidiphilus sp.]MDD3432257.1 tol-pal system-associated acyl-CoA thioesterase [Tepidiphilus sp.]
MAPSAPAAAHTLEIRVYYEDTDCAGVVYYANYLRFCERGRTEFLRALGFSQSRLMREHGIGFVVHRLQAHYRHPARLDDRLQLVTRVHALARASIVFTQRLWRDTLPIFDAEVTVACVDLQRGRPVALPAVLRTQIPLS